MRTALVTGATKGIGFSVTEHLLQHDFTVLALSRNASRLNGLRLEMNSPCLDIYSCDISDPDQVDKTFQALSQKYPSVDLLVNNAGVGYFESLQTTTRMHWQETIATNLSGPFYITQRCLPLLKKSDKPHIINLCSTASQKGFPGCTSYSASKFGLLGMTEVWREELRAERIRVTALISGTVRTPFWQSFENSFDTSLMLSPEEVAHTVLWIYEHPSGSSIDEIVIKPITGDQ